MFRCVSIFILLFLNFHSATGYGASVNLRLNINFKTNEALIDKDGQQVLRKLYITAQKFPDTQILISGHTDNVGPDNFNQALSLRRAEAVEAGLLGKGLERDRMVVKGFGESAPIAENSTPEGRFQNRRVVASILGLTDSEKTVIVGEAETGDVLEESSEVEDFKKNIVVKKVLVKVRKKPSKYYVAGFFGPHWSSANYGESVQFEHSRLNPISFGIDAGYKISKKWFADAYFYYLPTSVTDGDGIDFEGVNRANYENNIYGLRLGRYLRKTKRYRFSLIGGVSSHILGGIERTGDFTFSLSKFQHIGLTLGFRHEQFIAKSWVFDSDIAYLVPVSVDNLASGQGTFWCRGVLGVKRRLSNRWRLGIEYQAIYHESRFRFDSGFRTTPEFLIQTLMVGLKYNI